MSVRIGNTVIAGTTFTTKYNAHNLLDFKWSDKIINSMEWLRADTFSWQSGDVYTAVYNLLVAEYQNGSSSGSTETENGVSYIRSSNGYKITTDENAVISAYNTYGVSWYYILDAANKRFKLPRTKYSFSGIRNSVGKYISESLPKPTLIMRTDVSSSTDADLNAIYGNDGYTVTTPSYTSSVDEYMHRTYTTGSTAYMDIFHSSYIENAPVQQRATEMYLYFYVGEYTQTAFEQTAGITSEQINSKVDISSLVEAHAVIDSYVSSDGLSWYWVYDNGFIMQGGSNIFSFEVTNTNYYFTFPKAFTTTNYAFLRINRGNTIDGGLRYAIGYQYDRKETTRIGMWVDSAAYSKGFDWIAWGR